RSTVNAARALPPARRPTRLPRSHLNMPRTYHDHGLPPGDYADPDHRLGIIRGSAYSMLCRIRHRRETHTAGSASGLRKRSDGNIGTAPQADSTTRSPDTVAQTRACADSSRDT